MTKPYSLAFKQKMIKRLIGKNALTASQLARETGVRQQNLSRWLEEARSLPLVTADKRIVRDVCECCGQPLPLDARVAPFLARCAGPGITVRFAHPSEPA